jgi:hypothetical protein
MFKGQAAKEEDQCKPFMMGPMSRNVDNQLPTYAVQHPRTEKTTLQLHFKDQLVYTTQADFIVRIKVGTVFDIWGAQGNVKKCTVEI